MSVRLWISTLFDPVYRCGGWAYVRANGADLTGQAGGQRQTTAGGLAPLALAAALADLDPKAALTLHASPAVRAVLAALPAHVAAGWRTPDNEPVPDAELWKALLPKLGARPLTVLAAPEGKLNPTAFAVAWAELGRDKAKASGKPFASSIPKTNLAKVKGL
ncbi:hypothetical protein [Phenylobacterium aquaticum]|uniref:hypothetical protein n=1 Tax=Phenylobacterium aquaticum TaxID=1763816 RepID=UPI0026EA418B|nr:hypothetical protein [Phenylobacterium aquaticum]